MESDAMAFLDDCIRQAQAAIEQKFLFRKIGLPYDYASNPEDFPSKAFATAKEARANLPNPSGLGSGYAFSCRNHALLFDAYLLRIEAGIEAESDEQILDRLIGGLIRLDTVAPKSFLVGGLAPDGRGFYAQPNRENHAAWAFAVVRGMTTAAIAPESQEKFRSIVGKWIDKLKRDKFRLMTVDGKPSSAADIASPNPDAGPFLLAMLLAAARASGDDKDRGYYDAVAEEGGIVRLAKPEDFDPLADTSAFLWRQAALSVVAHHDHDPERTELARTRMAENAELAAKAIAGWRDWDRSRIDVEVDLNWRGFPKAPPDQSPMGFTPPESWARLENEAALEKALAAMYALLLPGDREFALPHARDIEDCIATLPWDKVMTLSALAPIIGVHARGAEMELWDKDLFSSRRESPSSETSFAARYLEPDYDEANPEKAGHLGPPPGKRRAEEGKAGDPDKGGKKRRRRRRK